jgi:hypothetical protein
MPFDAHKNLAITTLVLAPDPPTSGTSIGIEAAGQAYFPVAPFNATIWPAGQPPTPVNAEVVRVTAITGQFFTIVRAQEGTAARAIQYGDLIAATITAKVITDIESGLLFPDLWVNTPTQFGYPSRIAVKSNIATTLGMNIGTTTDSPGGSFVGFYNAGNSLQGSISAPNATTTAYNTTSDARLKDDLGAVGRDLAADVLRQTVVHEFTWKVDGTPGRGVFAQEAILIAPGAVTVGTDETTEAGALRKPWAVNYPAYIPDLIVGWQQHDALVVALTATIAALEARVAALEAALP